VTLSPPLPPREYLPVENATTSFWHQELHHLHDTRTTPQLPPASDVVIVGAGYAGIATAYHLTRGASRARDLSLTIIEARGVCSGATGRNGGHLRPDLYGHIPAYMDRAGVDAGREIAEFERAHLAAIQEVVEAEGIECDLTRTRTVDVWINEAAAAEAQATYERMTARQLSYMDDVRFARGRDAERISGVKGARACATYPAGTLTPYKLVLGLTRVLAGTAGVNIQTNTPVTAVSPHPPGGFCVATPRGTTYAQQVVYANNAHLAGLLPDYRRAIVPCKGMCAHLAAAPGARPPPLAHSYIIREEDGTLAYLAPQPDGSIVVGGANARYRPFLDQWYQTVDDSTLIKTGRDHFDGYMQRLFRGWEDSGAAVDRIWSGVMGYSFDSHPHVGRLPREAGAADGGQFVLAGFNGHGMPVIWLAAKGVAQMITTGVEFEGTGLPRLFKTTRERIERSLHGPEGGDILA
ncbi:hypothetical protein JHW43_004066, partial [Diplocarpon mali]